MEERVIIPDDGARGDGIKLISGVKRKRGLTLNQFKDYWHEKHAPLALSVLPKSPFVKKYVHNYAIPVEGFGEPAFDGIGELCFDDMEAFHKSTEWFMGEGGEVLREDEENFVDPTTRVVVIVRQRVIIP
jgi:uncharacterized protein (TIGR02118 family)